MNYIHLRKLYMKFGNLTRKIIVKSLQFKYVKNFFLGIMGVGEWL